ncbi:polysaccharide biosynthesis protein PslE [Gammaproteobacteria bacterium]
MDKNREESFEFSVPQSADGAEAEDITDTEFEVLLDSIASNNQELVFESSFPTDVEYENLLDFIYPIEHNPIEDVIYHTEVALPETVELVVPVEVPTQEKQEVPVESIIAKPMIAETEKVEKIETDTMTPIGFNAEVHTEVRSGEQLIKKVSDSTPTSEVTDSIKTPATKVEPVIVPLVNLSAPASSCVQPTKSPKKPVREKRAAPSYTIRDVLTVLFRERKLIVVVFFLASLSGVLFSSQLGIIYKAEARLLVLPSHEYALRSEVVETSLGMMGENQIVRSETEILKNLKLVERTIQTIGLDRLYPSTGNHWQIPDYLYSLLPKSFTESTGVPVAEVEPLKLDKALLNFSRQLEVSPIKDSSVIYLTFSHNDPVIAEDALNILLSTYLEYRRTIFYQPRSKFFIDQKEHFSQRLAKIEQSISKFKQQYDISAFSDQKALLVRQKTEIHNNKLDTETRLQEVETRLSALQKQISGIPKDITLYSENSNQDARDVVRATLVTLEARKNELLTRFQEKSQFILDLDEQIAKIKGILSASPPKKSDNQRIGRNPLYDDLNSEIAKRTTEVAALRARQNSLNGQFKEVSERLRQFDRLEQEFNGLAMEKLLLEKNLQNYGQKVEESLIQEEMDRQTAANVRVIQNAQSPREGRNLRRMILFLSLFGGVFLSIALAFVKDAFRQVLISPEDAERALGIPVLLTIPLHSHTGKPKWISRNRESFRPEDIPL